VRTGWIVALAVLIAAAIVAPSVTVRAQPVGGEGWAVVIGVGQYENPGIPSRKYAVADAEAFYEVLTQTAGFKRDNVLLLTDRSQRKPTARNIKFALGTFLGRSTKPDDTVLVYFSGHGAAEASTRGTERDGLAKYLATNDTDPSDLYGTAIPLADLPEILGRIDANRVVTFLEANYSGAVSSYALALMRRGAKPDPGLRSNRQGGRAFVASSRPSEISAEGPDLGHGVFTHYLVEGLKGAAYRDANGIVTLQALYEYVEAAVARKARAMGLSQHPMMSGELEGLTLPLIRFQRP
jgi:uncharacterized caspase-like protein